MAHARLGGSIARRLAWESASVVPPASDAVSLVASSITVCTQEIGLSKLKAPLLNKHPKNAGNLAKGSLGSSACIALRGSQHVQFKDTCFVNLKPTKFFYKTAADSFCRETRRCKCTEARNRVFAHLSSGKKVTALPPQCVISETKPLADAWRRTAHNE
jgi:hypothetical protein